jgi:hemerythrin-like domain-containing protein
MLNVLKTVIATSKEGEMKVQEVIDRVKAIQAKADDPEVAHSKEDALYLDVLRAIANGAKNSKELAKEALKTESIDFSRWYA